MALQCITKIRITKDLILEKTFCVSKTIFYVIGVVLRLCSSRLCIVDYLPCVLIRSILSGILLSVI